MANAIPRPGYRISSSRPSLLSRRTPGLTADHTHHNGLCRFTDAEQVEHFRARRTVRHAHIVEQRVLLAEQAEYLFALADVNDRYDECKAALRGHLRCMLYHIKYPPPAR